MVYIVHIVYIVYIVYSTYSTYSRFLMHRKMEWSNLREMKMYAEIQSPENPIDSEVDWLDGGTMMVQFEFDCVVASSFFLPPLLSPSSEEEDFLSPSFEEEDFLSPSFEEEGDVDGYEDRTTTGVGIADSTFQSDSNPAIWLAWGSNCSSLEMSFSFFPSFSFLPSSSPFLLRITDCLAAFGLAVRLNDGSMTVFPSGSFSSGGERFVDERFVDERFVDGDKLVDGLKIPFDAQVYWTFSWFDSPRIRLLEEEDSWQLVRSGDWPDSV